GRPPPAAPPFPVIARGDVRAPEATSDRERPVRAPGPPRWPYLATFAGLAALLFYPVHVPYQNPDQDMPVYQSIVEFVRGGWSPLWLNYPSALTNILRTGYELALALGHAGGSQSDRIDFLVSWYEHPELFRIPPRLIAMSAGVVSLLAVLRLTTLVG